MDVIPSTMTETCDQAPHAAIAAAELEDRVELLHAQTVASFEHQQMKRVVDQGTARAKMEREESRHPDGIFDERIAPDSIPLGRAPQGRELGPSPVRSQAYDLETKDFPREELHWIVVEKAAA
jgi:hypothetical protein